MSELSTEIGGNTNPYLELNALIGKYQDEKGSGGCYAELFVQIKSLGGVAHKYGENGIIEELKQLMESWPENQNVKVMKQSQKKLNQIREKLRVNQRLGWVFEALAKDPKSVRLVAYDLDDTLYQRGERPDDRKSAQRKVEVARRILKEAANRKNLSLINFIITTRPAESILDDEKVLKEFLNLKSMIKDDKEIKEVPLFLAFGELGAVRLLRKELGNENQLGPEKDKWDVEVDERFKDYCGVNGTREKLINFLNDRFVKEGKGDYQFEAGRLVGVSLQNKDESPLSFEQKITIKTAIEKELDSKELEKIAIQLDGSDVDIFPKELVKEAKHVGLKAIRDWVGIFLPKKIKYKQMIMVEDSGFTIDRHVRKRIKRNKPSVKIAAPANRDAKMAELLSEVGVEGATGEWENFVGSMQGLWQVLVN